MNTDNTRLEKSIPMGGSSCAIINCTAPNKNYQGHHSPGRGWVYIISGSGTDEGAFIPAMDVTIMGYDRIKQLRDLLDEAIKFMEKPLEEAK